MSRDVQLRDSNEVTLVLASVANAPLLSNLLELYIHDLSAVFPDIELGDDGRFGYPKLPLYWAEPERRFAFLIRRSGHVVGFVLVTRGSPVATDPDTFDIVEFFVLRRHRHAGVGRQAALLLWQRLVGQWTVRVSEGNTGAMDFWRSVIGEYTHGAATECERAGTPHGWRVYAFESKHGYTAGA